MSEKVNVLMPKYCEKFVCTGSNCPDNCCKDWLILIDKSTYLKYKKLPEGTDLKKKVNKYISRNRNSLTLGEKQYGKIDLDEATNKCGFLDENGLCEFQKQLGEGYLCKTCANFPRITSFIDGSVDRCLDLSCPEVAKLALFSDDALDFINPEVDLDEIKKDCTILNFDSKEYSGKAQKYFWDIRIGSLQILKDRRFTVEQRLLLIGLLYRRIIKLEQNNQAEKIPEQIESFVKDIDFSVKNMLNDVKPRIDIQLAFTDKVFSIKFTDKMYVKAYEEAKEQFELFFSFNNNHISSEIIAYDKFQQLYDDYFKPYIEKKPYVPENFIINIFFSKAMPFEDDNSLWDSYVNLCAYFAMFKITVICLAAKYQTVDDELIANAAYGITRRFLHNREFANVLKEVFFTDGNDSLAYVISILNN